MLISLYIWLVYLHCTASQEKSPNIVMILTDDQDLLLGGVTPMKKTLQLVANEGVTFKNAFVTTPICCPSRSSILTGQYQHNHKTYNNSLSGGCSNTEWQNNYENNTFAVHLKNSGYRTFYAGKYLNQYGEKGAGGTAHIPKGWDWWIGLVGNSKYYDYSMSVNGSKQHYSDKYLTDIIKSYSLDFIRSIRHKSESFLMLLAPPAPHAPFTPEPKYDGKYAGVRVPRTPNFNLQVNKDRHWLMRMHPSPLPDDVINTLDDIQAHRWETLMSVDDLVEAVVQALESAGQLDNTFIMFTSDHGFHLGQFSLAWDKREPYETDIRVPFFIRGPGVEKKAALESPVLNIDIAPTLLDIAGSTVPDCMDGLSFLPLIKKQEQDNRSRAFVVEYQGEGNKKSISSQCPWRDDNLAECVTEAACKCQDSRNNTYNCLRRIDFFEQLDFLYCEFPYEFIKEYYDLTTDPYQLNNKYLHLNEKKSVILQEDLHKLKNCKGFSCQLTD